MDVFKQALRDTFNKLKDPKIKAILVVQKNETTNILWNVSIMELYSFVCISLICLWKDTSAG